jgi:radical SAM-linked protein
MIRVRITYSKTQALRYTGTLDLQKCWERTFRRAKLPIAYSQGFHPQARIQIACPLPLGFLSQAEITDVWLEQELGSEEISQKLISVLQPGLEIKHIELVDINGKALQTVVQTSDYEVHLIDPHPLPGSALAISNLLAASELPRTWKEKNYDLRPRIESLSIEDELSDNPLIRMRLSVRESLTGRPEEVLSALGIDPTDTRIERTALALD